MASRLFSIIVATLGSIASGGQPCDPITEVRLVGPFAGVHANDGIAVWSTVRPSGNASLRLHANQEDLPQVMSSVDSRGTLVLGFVSGHTSSCVKAEISVPQPLAYAGASNSGEVIADEAAGLLQVSLGGEVVVGRLASAQPLGVFAETRGEVAVGTGEAGLLTVSSGTRSVVTFGNMTANETLISASYKASVSGLTVGVAHISAAGDSEVSLTATKAVTLVCSTSQVDIVGDAPTSSYNDWRCEVKRNGTRVSGAIFP
mmetsp:Transcript_3153/g.10530  ORF Transcript_3153/g.10530 Transcript_3153/m.10530 type:complete len:259 (+) Transcript_3153:64-840(+)